MKALLVIRNIAIVATLLTFSSPEPARAEEGCTKPSDGCLLCPYNGCFTLNCQGQGYYLVC